MQTPQFGIRKNICISRTMKKGASLGNRVQLKKGASLGKFGARLGNSRENVQNVLKNGHILLDL